MTSKIYPFVGDNGQATLSQDSEYEFDSAIEQKGVKGKFYLTSVGSTGILAAINTTMASLSAPCFSILLSNMNIGKGITTLISRGRLRAWGKPQHGRDDRAKCGFR
jgi:hypothetical protein